MLSDARKVAGVNALVGPALTLIVPAVKSMATVFWTRPDEFRMATVLWPEKPDTAVGRSRPVLRPVREVGGGSAVAALWAAFNAWAVRETNSPIWSAMPGSFWSRRSRRPRISPEFTVIDCGPLLAPAVSTVMYPGVGSEWL